MNKNDKTKKAKDEALKKESIKEKIQTLKENNKFFKFILNGKNISIIILSFLLFCAFCAYTNPVDVTQYENKITELNDKLEYNEKQITNLKEENQLLQKANSTLEEEKQTLENEKNKLTTKVDELENASTVSSSSEVQNSSTSTDSSLTNSSKSSSETSTISTTNNQSYTVYITNTGSKYHSASCSYLRKSKIAISLSEAKSKGYTACSKCNP